MAFRDSQAARGDKPFLQGEGASHEDQWPNVTGEL